MIKHILRNVTVVIVCATFMLIYTVVDLRIFNSKSLNIKDNIPPDVLNTKKQINKKSKIRSQKVHSMSVFKNYSTWTSSDLSFESLRKFVGRTHITCPKKIRLGNVGEGGWWYCATQPFTLRRQGCIVYSFGIGYDFRFDDDIANIYNCTVRSFDPSMDKFKWRAVKQGSFTKRGENIWFYKIGIGGNNTEPPKWKVQTLGTIMSDNKERNKTIDMLKVDVEHDEWESFLTMAKEKSYVNVKQLAFEIHFHTFNHGYYFNVLKQIEEVGFRKYHMVVNKSYPRQCFEVYYVNTKYL